MVRIGAYADLGFMLLMFQWRCDYGTISLLCSSARRSYVMGLEIPGCDEGDLEDQRKAGLSRGKGLFAGFRDWQNNERGMLLA